MRERLTEFRKNIIKLLDGKGIPLSVKEIYESQQNANISTVYRAVEYLESSGSIKSIIVPCTCGQLRYYYTGKSHIHYLHCEVCHKFFPIPFCGLKNNIEKNINTDFHFNITGHILLFTGKCSKCS